MVLYINRVQRTGCRAGTGAQTALMDHMSSVASKVSEMKLRNRIVRDYQAGSENKAVIRVTVAENLQS